MAAKELNIITTQEVAKKYGISDALVRDLIRREVLSPIRALGIRPYRFDEEQVLEAIKASGSLKSESVKAQAPRKARPLPLTGRKKTLWDQ